MSDDTDKFKSTYQRRTEGRKIIKEGRNVIKKFYQGRKENVTREGKNDGRKKGSKGRRIGNQEKWWGIGKIKQMGAHSHKLGQTTRVGGM